MRLVIPINQESKLTYLLDRYNSEEWSGPAWYSVKKTDKDSFPEEVTLEEFYPLDLGGHSSTEWEAKDCAKILKSMYKLHPKLKKSYMGHIHSHHNMGAFFSGTDTETMNDNAAAKGFFFSLIVAHSKAKYAFSVSYVDQYGFPQMIECDEKEIISKKVSKVNPEWELQADDMDKKRKVVPNRMTTYTRNVPNGQTTMFRGVNQISSKLTKKQKRLFDKWTEAYDSHEMTYHEFTKKCDSIGVDPHEQIDNASFGGSPYGGTQWY